LKKRGLRAPWFRALFNIEINGVKSTAAIFCEKSAVSISGGVFLRTVESEFSVEGGG
jgi:hypothetical protein